MVVTDQLMLFTTASTLKTSWQVVSGDAEPGTPPSFQDLCREMESSYPSSTIVSLYFTRVLHQSRKGREESHQVRTFKVEGKTFSSSGQHRAVHRGAAQSGRTSLFPCSDWPRLQCLQSRKGGRHIQDSLPASFPPPQHQQHPDHTSHDVPTITPPLGMPDNAISTRQPSPSEFFSYQDPHSLLGSIKEQVLLTPGSGPSSLLSVRDAASPLPIHSLRKEKLLRPVQRLAGTS